MKILQINTYDIQGGAARAVHRLHKGLQQRGEDSRMLVRYKRSPEASIISVISGASEEAAAERVFFLETIQSQYIDAHRTAISNTHFSLPYPSFDLSSSSLIQGAQIINLHWVAYFQSPVTLSKLFSSGTPVVWTLHDQRAFTGGCHYSAGCDRYKSDCSACPQLADDSFDFAAAVLKDNLELFKNAKLTIVTPSHWLAALRQGEQTFQRP